MRSARSPSTRLENTSVRKEDVFAICFGDTQEDIDAFYAISDAVCIEEKENGETVGIAHVLPVFLEGYRGGYLYAIGVAPEHRGKGLFARLLERCEAFCRAWGLDFVCLIPATEALADTYRRYGYHLEIATVSGNRQKDSHPVRCLSEEFLAYGKHGSCEGAPKTGLAKSLSGKPLPTPMHFASPLGELL